LFLVKLAYPTLYPTRKDDFVEMATEK